MGNFLKIKALQPTVIKQKIEEKITAMAVKKSKKGCASCGKR
jgi:hypothetical protein